MDYKKMQKLLQAAWNHFILPPLSWKKGGKQDVRPNLLAGPANILDTKPTSVTGGMDFSEEWTLDESIAAVHTGTPYDRDFYDFWGDDLLLG